MSAGLTGDWELAERILNASAPMLDKALKKAVAQEAIHFEALVVDRLRAGPPPELSPWTIASRKAGGGRGGSKPLNASGDMLGSVSTVPAGLELEKFIGIPRSAPGHGGMVVRLAEIHEFGITIVVQITPKMRRFLAMMAAKMAKKKNGRFAGPKRPPGTGKRFLVIFIPPRPFIVPAFYEGAQEAQKRFAARIFKLLEPVVKGTTTTP